MMSTQNTLIVPPQLQAEALPGTGTVQALAPAKHSKADLVRKLLRRAKGATLAELQEATAWQPHSVRAFLSGLRKKGSPVAREQRKSGETAYRFVGKSIEVATADA